MLDPASPTLLLGAFFLGFSQREFSSLGKKVFALVLHEVEDPTKISTPGSYRFRL